MFRSMLSYGPTAPFNGSTGAFIDEFVAAGSDGLDEPLYSRFVPEQQVTVVSN